MSRTPAPYNESAERSLLGAAMLAESALEILAQEVEPEDLYVPRNVSVAATLRRMFHGGQKVDAVTLADELRRTGDLERVGGVAELVALEVGCPSSSNARNYARIILDHAVRRRLIAASGDLHETSKDLGLSIEEVYDKARRQFNSLDLPVVAGEPDANVDTFLEGPEEYNWLIEGLMEKMDRLIITGIEGGGKSSLLRQVAVCAAAGLHPFRFTRVKPLKVLIVDCENSEIQTRRKLRQMIGLARRACPEFDPNNLRINIKVDGLDLLQRLDVRWLMERLEANQPDLLVIGPMYKLHAGDPTDEAPARKVSRALDMARFRYGCALLMEAHSPYANIDGKRVGRPYGASLWSRWPEFGYSIAIDKDNRSAAQFDAWRGPRDERDWPRDLNWDGEKGWPWGDARYDPNDVPPPEVDIGWAEEQF